MDGGERIARVLVEEGVESLFTLCGGHISPILAGAKRLGIRVIDTRHEATAVFAADATARLKGNVGVAAVTAGPGVTNSLTALRNARMAHSPLVLLGGATAGPLRGRGALQDIDQIDLIRSHVKWLRRAKRVADLAPLLREACAAAKEGVPGPVFLECGVDLLYDERIVRDWFERKSSKGPRPMRDRVVDSVLRRHLARIFAPEEVEAVRFEMGGVPAREKDVRRAAARLERASRPVFILGSQVAASPERNGEIRRSLERIGAPVWLSGMARGLMGADHPLLMRHHRREALREADLVVLAGVPCDFRLDYGRQIRHGSTLVAINRSPEDLRLNRKPSLAIHADPGELMTRLGEVARHDSQRWDRWREELRGRDAEREVEISCIANEQAGELDPVHLLREIDRALPDDSVIVADGGDFVGTASYVVRPRAPLSWLDPGPFGTLGVGAGFALAAALARPGSEVWLLWGDGSAGFGLMEIDTFVRHRLPLIAVIGNDAGWTQIAREQIEILGDDVGCRLLSSDYHLVAEALGGTGLDLRNGSLIHETIRQARQIAAGGRPVVINARIGASTFRKGSISM